MLTPAVSLLSIAVAVHVAAVVVAFEPLFAYPALTHAARRSDPTALAAVYRARHVVARNVTTPALPTTLIAGLYLAAEEHVLARLWVVVPLVALVVLMALHRLVLLDGYRRLADSAGASDGRSGPSDLARRVSSAERVSAALVLFTIFVMSAKPVA
jgi:hypothetical protein